MTLASRAPQPSAPRAAAAADRAARTRRRTPRAAGGGARRPPGRARAGRRTRPRRRQRRAAVRRAGSSSRASSCSPIRPGSRAPTTQRQRRATPRRSCCCRPGFSPDTSAESVTAIGIVAGERRVLRTERSGRLRRALRQRRSAAATARWSAPPDSRALAGRRRTRRPWRICRRARRLRRTVRRPRRPRQSDPRQRVSELRLVGARHRAVRAERSADRQAGLLSAAARRDARRSARDPAHRQQPAHVLLRQLHRATTRAIPTMRTRRCRRWPSAPAISPRSPGRSSIR